MPVSLIPASVPRSGIRLIAAVSKNGIIGHKGGLPWSIPEDRTWFEQNVQEGILVLGRRSFDETGFAIPGVHATIVITSKEMACRDAHAAKNFQDALDIAKSISSETGRIIWIGGGHRIYCEALPYASHLYLTEVNAWVCGDTRFPAYFRQFFPTRIWSRESADHNYAYRFSVLEAPDHQVLNCN